MESFIILAPILAPLGAAFVTPFISLISRKLIPAVCIAAMVLSSTALGLAAGPVFQQEKILVYWMGGWTPEKGVAIGISIAIDAWGLIIAMTIATVGFLAIIYSIVYMREETGKEQYYILMMLLIAALTGFVLTGDLFNQFVWLEILSFASFALTAFHYENRISIEGAFKYLITNSVAALFIVTALALLYATTGVLNLAAAAGEFGKTSGQMVALGLLFAGYATKTALVPWHFWLPDAYQGAPAPVTALFSGALSKMGIYAIGRLLFTLTPVEFNFFVRDIFLVVAAITMLVGGFQMLRLNSIKRILAYSSISQMGYILMGLSVGTPLGIAAATLHVINHALVKTALFFGSGTLEQNAGVSDLTQGGGLVRRMPVTFALMTLAGLSLSGMPLWIGFISKTMLEDAAVQEGNSWIAVLSVVASVFTFSGMARLLWLTFFGKNHGNALKDVHRSHPLTVFSMAVPVALALLFGVAPSLALSGFAWPVASVLLQPGRYVGMVLNQPNIPPFVTFPLVSPPYLLHWTVWIIPGIIVLTGILLAYYSLPGKEAKFWGVWPFNQVYYLAYRWHSGNLADYVLWNAFSTSILLILFVLFFVRII